MKKIFALLFLTTAVLTATAQGAGHAAMKFSGKSTIEAPGVTIPLETDTVMYSGQEMTVP